MEGERLLLLPSELTSFILSHLSLRDKLALRACCKTMSCVVLRELRQLAVPRHVRSPAKLAEAVALLSSLSEISVEAWIGFDSNHVASLLSVAAQVKRLRVLDLRRAPLLSFPVVSFLNAGVLEKLDLRGSDCELELIDWIESRQCLPSLQTLMLGSYKEEDILLGVCQNCSFSCFTIRVCRVYSRSDPKTERLVQSVSELVSFGIALLDACFGPDSRPKSSAETGAHALRLVVLLAATVCKLVGHQCKRQPDSFNVRKSVAVVIC